jgi:hypothetical protein
VNREELSEQLMHGALEVHGPARVQAADGNGTPATVSSKTTAPPLALAAACASGSAHRHG